MWNLIVALLMLYMAYQNVRSLVAIPFAQWQGVHWGLAAVTLGLVAAAIFCVVRYYKGKKKQEEELEAKQAEEKARRAAEDAQAAQEDGYDTLFPAEEGADTDGELSPASGAGEDTTTEDKDKEI